MCRILDPEFTIFYLIHLLLHSTSWLNQEPRTDSNWEPSNKNNKTPYYSSTDQIKKRKCYTCTELISLIKIEVILATFTVITISIEEALKALSCVWITVAWVWDINVVTAVTKMTAATHFLWVSIVIVSTDVTARSCNNKTSWTLCTCIIQWLWYIV